MEITMPAMLTVIIQFRYIEADPADSRDVQRSAANFFGCFCWQPV